MKTLSLMNPRSLLGLGALALTVSLLSGCMEDTAKNGGAADEKTTGLAVLEQVVVENIAQNVIVATYRDLNDDTHEMVRLAKVLQANPSEANLQAVQNIWRKTRVPWESSESFVMGPSLDTDMPIDTWPLAVTDLNHILATRADLSPAFVRSLNNDLKGFHTAEFLLFGDGIQKNTKSIAEMTSAQMTYLVSVTMVIAEETNTLYKRWTEKFEPSIENSKAYLEYVRAPSLENPYYPTRKAVLEQYVRAMSKIATEVGANKLKTPLGGNIGAAEPSQVESQFSWNSLEDFKNNVQSLRNVYTGDYAGRSGAGLDEIVKLRNPDLDAKMLALFDQAEKAIVDIGGPENLSYTLAIKNEAARARAEIAISVMTKVVETIDAELLKVVLN